MKNKKSLKKVLILALSFITIGIGTISLHEEHEHIHADPYPDISGYINSANSSLCPNCQQPGCLQVYASDGAGSHYIKCGGDCGWRTTTATCTLNYSIPNSIGSYNDDSHTKGCIYCHYVDTTTAEAHTYDSYGHCSVCSYNCTHSGQKNYTSQGSSQHLETCASCGKIIASGAHSHDANGVCVCGHKIYKVTYDANAGTDTVTNLPTDNHEYNQGDNVYDLIDKNTIPSYFPVRSGYLFKGWSLTSTGTVANTATFGTENITLYAIWEKGYTVSYDFNAGTDTVTNTQYFTSKTLSEGATYYVINYYQPARTGYNFLGWSYSKTGSVITDSTITIGKADVVFYARWQSTTPLDNVTINTEAQNKTYNGSAQGYTLAGDDKDIGNFTIKYYVNNEWSTTAPTDVGSYKVQITRDEDNAYNAYSKEIDNGLVITPKEIIIDWCENNFTYNSKVQTVTATYKDINNTDVSLTVTLNDTFLDAGDYVATASFKNNEVNYKLPSTVTKNYTINPGSELINSKPVEETKKPETGTKAEIIKGSLPNNITVVIVKEENENPQAATIAENIKTAVSNKSELVAEFEIHLEDQNGIKVANIAGNKYRITLALPTELQGKTGYAIVYIKDDASVEKYDATQNGNSLVFETTHFSNWGIVADSNNGSGTGTGTNTPTSNPSIDANVLYIVGACGIAIVLFIIFFLFFRKSITFIVNDKKIDKIKYRIFQEIHIKGQKNSCYWYLDKDLTKPFNKNRMGFKSITIYGEKIVIKKDTWL